MLNKSQTSLLESLQYSALKIIFGFDKSRQELLSLAKLPTLEARRDSLFKKFCLKTFSSNRFSSQWLETRNFTGHDLRQQQIIVEKHAKTDRLYKSLLYTIRRTLNDILVT